MMKFSSPLGSLGSGFAKLRLRERVILIVAVAIFLGLGGNLLLLKPQQLQINALRSQEATHRSELAALQRTLVEVRREEEQGVDPLSAERAQLAGMYREIRATEMFLVSEEDSNVSQVGILIRSLIRANPDLKLVSLKTLPASVFYTPPAAPQPKQEAVTQVDKLLDTVKKKEEVKPPPVVLVNKALYKHGVEVTLKGNYPALLSYMREMQKFPKRIFWSQATLDAKKHQEATLKMVVYSLSDQSNTPLN